MTKAYDNEMKIEFLSKSKNEAFARIAVAAFIAQLDPTVEEVADIKTAVSEAVTNSIIHGYEDSQGIIKIHCEIQDDYIIIEISDTGKGIEDIGTAKQPLYTSKPNLERSGMGFTIMESFMDTMKVESIVGLGTKITLTKKIKKEKEIQEKEKIDLIKKQQELEQASKVDTANTGEKISSEDVLETVKVTPKEEVVTDNNNANTSDGKLDVSKEKTHTTVVTEKKQVEIDAKDIGAPEVSQVVNTVAATPVVVEEEPEVLDMNVTVISPEQVLSAVKVGVKKEEPKVDNKSKRKKGKR